MELYSFSSCFKELEICTSSEFKFSSKKGNIEFSIITTSFSKSFLINKAHETITVTVSISIPEIIPINLYGCYLINDFILDKHVSSITFGSWLFFQTTVSEFILIFKLIILIF